MLYVVLISQMFFHGCVQVYLFFNTLSYVPCITMLLLCFILISHIFSRLCKCVPSIMLLLCFVKKNQFLSIKLDINLDIGYVQIYHYHHIDFLYDGKSSDRL